jgi:hypothetical protein
VIPILVFGAAFRFWILDWNPKSAQPKRDADQPQAEIQNPK